MLRVNGLCVDVHTGGGTSSLLHDVNVSVDSGEVVGLVGESGSGKSMTLRTILGTLPSVADVSGGSVELDGEDILTMSPKRLRQVRAEMISLIPQNPQASLNPVLRVAEYIVEGVVAADPSVKRQEAMDRARSGLSDVGIPDPDRILGSFPHQLSGGLLQRVVIAGAVARGSRLILADEPTTALDVTTQSEVMAILTELQQKTGVGMLYVTHDLDLAAAVCNRILVMRRGEIVESGSPREVLEQPSHEYTRGLVDAKPSLDFLDVSEADG